MNKKTLIIVILAGILALLGAFAIMYPKKQEPVKKIPQEEEQVTPIPEPEPIKVIENETKPVVTQSVKKVSHKKATSEPAITELPKLKPIVVKEAEAEPIHNDGIIKEENSTDIIILKEYKAQSPAKYSFK